MTSLFLTISWGLRKLILSLQKVCSCLFIKEGCVYWFLCFPAIVLFKINKQHSFAHLAEHQLQASQSLRIFEEWSRNGLTLVITSFPVASFKMFDSPSLPCLSKCISIHIETWSVILNSPSLSPDHWQVLLTMPPTYTTHLVTSPHAPPAIPGLANIIAYH